MRPTPLKVGNPVLTARYDDDDDDEIESMPSDGFVVSGNKKR